MVSGRCITHGFGPFLPPSAGVYGSIGSTWVRSDSTIAEDVLWIKTSAAPNNPVAGWQRACDVHSVYTRGDADVTLGASSSRTCIYVAPITADRSVFLPTALLSPGIRFRVVREAAATGSSRVDVKDGVSTLKSLNAGEWCEAECTGTAWKIVGAGAL